MPTPRVIFVGGFLGAGKTTLLGKAVEHLARQGRRPGLITNDLVDGEVLKGAGSQVEDVSGGCICCRFPDMMSAMERLVSGSGVDVLIGEPVGSCIDLATTVVQPLKRFYGHRFEVAPFSVLIDVRQVGVLARLRKASQADPPARFPDSVLYIYEKQLEEADLIVLNKSDMISAGDLAELKASLTERFPNIPLLTMSALTGDGVGTWFDFISQGQASGKKLAGVDYDTYAAGEAALGWMNASAQLQARGDIDWKTFATDLLEAIRGELRVQSAEIAHLKLYLTSSGGNIVGNVTSNDGPLSLRGEIASGQQRAALLLNARVHAHPDALGKAVEKQLNATAGDRVEAKITNIRSFFPDNPQPSCRIESIK